MLTLYMLSSSTKLTMSYSTSSSVYQTSVAMSSLATSSSNSVNVNGSAVPAAASHVNGSAVPAAASHVNDSVVPATASHLPVPVKDIAAMLSDMSISKPIVKPASASPSTSHASKSRVPVSMTTSASKGRLPLRQHSEMSQAAVLARSASVSERIAERRRRVVANLAAGSKRPTPPVNVTPLPKLKSHSTASRVPVSTSTVTAPVSTSQHSSTSLAVAAAVPVIPAAVSEPTVTAADAADAIPEPVPTATPAPRRYGWIYIQWPFNYRQQKPGKSCHIANHVEISDRVWNSDSLIPSASTGRRRRVQVPGAFRPATYPLTRTPIPDKLSPVFLPHTTSQLPRYFPHVFLPLHPAQRRRSDAYCSARPRRPGPRRNYGYGCLYKGRKCSCRWHDGIPTRSFHIGPRQWDTTPAESGVDPHPSRKKSNKPPRTVRFADGPQDICPIVKPWKAVFIGVYPSEDDSTIEEDFPEGFPLYN